MRINGVYVSQVILVLPLDLGQTKNQTEPIKSTVPGELSVSHKVPSLALLSAELLVLMLGVMLVS